MSNALPAATALPDLSTPKARRAFVGQTLFALDSWNRTDEVVGSHFRVLKCGPKVTKLANVTWGTAEGASPLWHRDVPTEQLAQYGYRMATNADPVYDAERVRAEMEG